MSADLAPAVTERDPRIQGADSHRGGRTVREGAATPPSGSATTVISGKASALKPTTEMLGRTSTSPISSGLAMFPASLPSRSAPRSLQIPPRPRAAKAPRSAPEGLSSSST